MKTLITGCSGLVGTALVEYLFKKGHSIQCLKRDLKPNDLGFWATEKLVSKGDTAFDSVIHLAGENVADGRWTKKKKERILKSRVEGTRELVDYISMLTKKPEVLLCASAVGFYGSRGDQILHENSSLGKGFLAEVCRQWEKEANRLGSMGIRVVNLRLGMILSPFGGALHKMVPPVKAGVGGTLGAGNQYISWVSINDLVEIVNFIIDNKQLSGPINVVSPIPSNNRELTKKIGVTVNKRTPFKIPEFLVRLLFGQMADEMLLTSSRVTPRVLLEAGYEFRDQSIDHVLDYCIKGA